MREADLKKAIDLIDEKLSFGSSVAIKRPGTYDEAVYFLKLTNNEKWLNEGFSTDGYSILATAQSIWDNI
jgi:hypothetical protein